MMAAEPEPRPAITKVWAKNFRSIEYAELELDPLTVLVGPNASGKSNLLDILGFLSDAARDGLESAINRRGGIDSIRRRSEDGRALGLELGFEYTSPMTKLQYSFALARRGGVEHRVRREFAKIETPDSSGGSCVIEFTGGRLAKPNLKKVFEQQTISPTSNSGSADGRTRTTRRLLAENNDQDLQLISPKFAGKTSLLTFLLSRSSRMEEDPYLRLGSALYRARTELNGIRLYHIFPNSLQGPQKVADSHPLAPAGENLASALRDMEQSKSRFWRDLKHAMNYVVPGVSDIRVRRAGSFQVVELKHGNEKVNGKGSWFDLSFESDGTIRLLAMLVALFQEPTPPIIGLEEPELAIHPGVMAVLAETMQETSLRGQVVVATHSPDLIDRLPVESIRAVSAESGSTKVGKVVPHQLKSVREGLFSAGELHGLMGLYPEDAGE